MQLVRMIKANWSSYSGPKVLEGFYDETNIKKYNKLDYNIYFLPNYPTTLPSNRPIDGSDITSFHFVFVDCDLKDGVYTKDTFIEAIEAINIPFTKIVDSGNGIHVYWKVSNLDALSFLRFQRRLCRLLNTDEAVSKIFQLMRLPGTLNVKYKYSHPECHTLGETEVEYTAEQLDKLLPPITTSDEAYCQAHYNTTYQLHQEPSVSEDLPPKFGKLLRSNKEVASLWAEPGDDRSKADFRLGHILNAHGFTKDEAASVLINSAKASLRAPMHRQNYAKNIVDKIWTFEEVAADTSELNLSMSVREILEKTDENTIKGTRFYCNKLIDDTHHGFRLGQVLGLAAGSGVGKTAVTLNAFRWFVENNPDYIHFFVPLEQPANEIADRWKTLCGSDTSLHDKVHIMSNYAQDGSFRRLSLNDIKDYIKKFQEVKKVKVGCVVIDHIGALKTDSPGLAGLEAICHSMKAFAIETNTFLIMQSQVPREKAGIGDLELNKDAAYGTVFFEAYCDYLVTVWQPLKRCHDMEECPTITAFKFGKIRHKKAKLDHIKEDVCYYLYFDSNNESLRELTEIEEKAVAYFQKIVNTRRKAAKEGVTEYKSTRRSDTDNAAS